MIGSVSKDGFDLRCFLSRDGCDFGCVFNIVSAAFLERYWECLGGV